jgi:16S rRNA (uracil1498-N3)-methyltransferase
VEIPDKGRQNLTIPRIFSPIALEEGKLCQLGHDNYKYLKQILRLTPGSRINIFDGFGHEFTAVIKNFSADGVGVALGEKIETAGREIKITLGQALPKANKMDVIVRNAAELGADVIIPFRAERSVSRIPDEKSSLKTVRWQKIAREAARCCRSALTTDVLPITSLEGMLGHASQEALKMIFWEEEEQKSIKDILTAPTGIPQKDFFVVVGPEGGFSKDEISKAKEAGFISVSLGSQILKVETAATAIISIIQYEKGIFSNIPGGKNACL